MDLYALVLFAEDTAPPPQTTAGVSIWTILTLIATWLIFKKAGERGWAAIIPLYGTYVLYQIVWGKGWKFLLLLIPIYNIILHIRTMIRLAHAFGKGTGFGWGLVLLNPIFLCILAFGDAQYQGVQA